jgi:hypothetical protein
VLGLECSRLARNSADWHQLLELSAMNGLAHPRQPQSPLPRDDQERPLATPPRGRAQPTPTHHPRTRPRRHRLGDRLNLASHPCRPAQTDADWSPTRRASSSSNHGCDSRPDRLETPGASPHPKAVHVNRLCSGGS